MAKSYLRFWGVRGSYATPFSSHMRVGGNTSCVEINVDGHLLVCDAGTGIIPLGNQLLAQKDNRAMLIILTHYHWDHICGLPFFTPAFAPASNINFFGPGHSAEGIRQYLEGQMQAPYFPVSTESWLANIHYLNPKHTEINHGPIDISYFNVHHPGITYGYRIRIGAKTVIYISDNECQFLDKSIRQKLGEFNEEEQTLFQIMNREEYEYELEAIKDADILIHDAQYTPEDYQVKRGWGHSCYIDVVNYAIDARVKALYIYHHDPYNDDQAVEAIHARCLEIISERKAGLQCVVAREGLQVPLD